MYTLLYSLTCLIVLAYIRLWRGRRRGNWWIVYAVAALAGLWTHFFAGLVVAAVVSHYCLARLWPRFAADGSSPGWLGFALTNGAVFCAFVLYIPHFIERLPMVTTWRAMPSLGNLVGLPLALTASQFLRGPWQTAAMGCLTFLLIVVGLQAARALWHRCRGSEWLLLLGILLVVPVMASFTVSHIWTPVFAARVLIVVVPALYLLLAWGAVHPREHRFNQFLLALLLPQMMLGLHNWFFDPSYAKPPVRDAVRLVQDVEPADAPVFHAIAESFMVFEHYAPNLDNALLTDPVQPRVGRRVDPNALTDRRFWLVVLPTYDQESQLALRNGFDRRFHRRQEWNVGGVRLYRYALNES